MVTNSLFEIEIVYALPETQFCSRVSVPFGSTVRDGIIRSGVLSKFSDLRLESLRVGIFSQLVDLDTLLKNDDRIEIYRPLRLSPTMARRMRAKKSTSQRSRKPSHT